MTKELKQDYTLRIAQANKTQLVVILYEMTLTYLKEASEAYDKGEGSAFKDSIRKARGCIKELIASLHFEYEPARNLLQLYIFANKELTRASVQNSKKELDHVKKMMEKLHEAYEKIAEADKSGPVMSNAQTVYAGLTYGKNSLVENLANQGSERGFRV